MRLSGSSPLSGGALRCSLTSQLSAAHSLLQLPPQQPPAQRHRALLRSSAASSLTLRCGSLGRGRAWNPGFCSASWDTAARAVSRVACRSSAAFPERLRAWARQQERSQEPPADHPLHRTERVYSGTRRQVNLVIRILISSCIFQSATMLGHGSQDNLATRLQIFSCIFRATACWCTAARAISRAARRSQQ